MKERTNEWTIEQQSRSEPIARERQEERREKKWFELINFYDFASFHQAIWFSRLFVCVRKKGDRRTELSRERRAEKWKSH